MYAAIDKPRRRDRATLNPDVPCPGRPESSRDGGPVERGPGHGDRARPAAGDVAACRRTAPERAASERPILTHGTFVIERSYGASPQLVFAAWSDPKAKVQWFVGPDEWQSSDQELDFRVGGLEHDTPAQREHGTRELLENLAKALG